MVELNRQLEEIVSSLNRILEDFNQAQNITTTSHLNNCLALVREYIDQFNGIIDIINTYHRASRYFSQFWNFYERSNIDIHDLVSSAINSPLNSEHNDSMLVHSRFQFSELKAVINFSKKLGDFGKNVVGVGANGSGKSTLAEKLKSHMNNNGVVISAQKILLIPEAISIGDPTQTAQELKDYQTQDKTNKNPNYISSLQFEFSAILANLFAENNAINHKYRQDVLEALNKGQPFPTPTRTNLDTTIELWNRLMENRKITIKDGINLVLTDPSGEDYPATRMSDGEKAILFLVAQVLQAPSDGFILIDEPETHLHRSISKRLWDALETERSDCIFIYFTHDLDFAASRSSAKKIWIKSISFPDKFEIEEMDDSTPIPETLLLELIGESKDILFCEGVRGTSKDERIYKILLPHLTITPVGNCLNVISYVKAYNKIENRPNKAFGLVDRDHQPIERLESLERSNIYALQVAEIENLLLDETLLIGLSLELKKPHDTPEKIKKDIISRLAKQKEIQAANFVSSKIDYYYKDSNLTKGNNAKQLYANLQTFNEKIDIDSWLNTRITEINEAIAHTDYIRVISYLNDKNEIIKIANQHFDLVDFTDQAIKFLEKSKSCQNSLKKHLPHQILDSRLGSSCAG